jgi:geranylgeranyl transferase type-1 subunit beta
MNECTALFGWSDHHRITIAYFCLSALDLLGALEEKTTQEQRNGWVEWIWSLQTGKTAYGRLW